MSLYRYTDSREDDRKLSYAEALGKKDRYDHADAYEEKDSFRKGDCEKPEKPEKHDCDSESARALKKILSLLDELNNEDLRILEDVIERLLCSREKKRPW